MAEKALRSLPRTLRQRLQHIRKGSDAFGGGIARHGFEGFDQKRAQAAGWVNDLVAFLQSHPADNVAGDVRRRVMLAQAFALAGVKKLAVDVAQHILLDGGKVEVRKIKQGALDGEGEGLVIVGQHPVQFIFIEDRGMDFRAFVVDVANHAGVADAKILAASAGRL